MDNLPEPQVIRAVIQRYGALTSQLGEELGERPLVLPNSKYFPDTFSPTGKGATRVLRRMQQHTGLDDVPISVDVIGEQEQAAGGSCGTGGCGTSSCEVPDTEGLQRVVPHGDGWKITLAAPELTNPILLTSTLAYALGQIFLFETAEEGTTPADLSLNAEFAAVGLGLGALLLEASYVYSKSCGGPRVAKLTQLGCGELGIATALFAKQQRQGLRAALSELSTTQQAVLKEARDLVDSNPRISELLATAPEVVARGEFELSDSRPWLVRLFGKRKATSENPETIEEMEALAARMGKGASKDRVSSGKQKRDPRKDELRSLVEEALKEQAPGAQSRADAE